MSRYRQCSAMATRFQILGIRYGDIVLIVQSIRRIFRNVHVSKYFPFLNGFVTFVEIIFLKNKKERFSCGNVSFYFCIRFFLTSSEATYC